MINSIRTVRRAKGLTLDEVGQRCDPPTTAQTIGRLETGTRTLSLGWMNRIAKALGVDAADLVQLPQDTQLTITALLGADGAQAPTRVEQALTARPGEEMSDVADRLATVRKLEREVASLERKLRTEPQLNRKVELRRTLKTKQHELEQQR